MPMLFIESGDHCAGIFHYVAVAFGLAGAQPVTGESLRAAVHHCFSGHRGRHYRYQRGRSAIGQRACAAADSIHVVVDVSSGTDFVDSGYFAGHRSGGRRAAAENLDLDAGLAEQIQDRLAVASLASEKGSVLTWINEKIAGINHHSAKLQARQGLHVPYQFNDARTDAYTTTSKAGIDFD